MLENYDSAHECGRRHSEKGHGNDDYLGCNRDTNSSSGSRRNYSAPVAADVPADAAAWTAID